MGVGIGTLQTTIRQWIKRLFGIIKRCHFCGKLYDKKDRRYIRSNKSKAHWRIDSYGRRRVNIRYPIYECCMNCKEEYKMKEDKRFKKELRRKNK